MATPELRTKEGWELNSPQPPRHFALTTELHDALQAAGQSRVVVVSSSATSTRGALRRPRLRTAPVRRVAAYSQSKTANILFAVEAAKRWPAMGSPSTRSTRPHCGHQSESPHGDTTGNFDRRAARSIGEDIEQERQHPYSWPPHTVDGSPGDTSRTAGSCPFETGVRRGITEYALDPRRRALWQSRSTRLRAPDEFSTGRHKRFHHQRKNRHGNVVQPIQLNTNSVLEG